MIWHDFECTCLLSCDELDAVVGIRRYCIVVAETFLRLNLITYFSVFRATKYLEGKRIVRSVLVLSVAPASRAQ